MADFRVGLPGQWIAPFHFCPRCGASLNWKEDDSLHLIAASCCGTLEFCAMLDVPCVPPEPTVTDAEIDGWKA